MSADLESGRGRRQRRWRRRQQRGHQHSVVGSSETTTDRSLCFSDYNDQSWHSPLGSTAGGSFDECNLSEIEGVLDGNIRSLDLSGVVDLESGDLELKAHSAKEQRDCRICHLNLVGCSGDEESGVAIELGCSYKGDSTADHKQYAETWFKIRGNTKW
ncbi:hypothetical protein U1Q18_023398 [Sarracenia purpurea var. burkii]